MRCQLIILIYILCNILQVEEGDDEMVLPDDTVMYDEDNEDSEADEDDDEHDN